MISRFALAVLFCLPLGACASTTPAVVDVDPAMREPLFAAVTALEGRWEGSAEMEGEAVDLVAEFAVSSGGSVVREVMSPGGPFEMTNMYALDGNGLVMTHYCAAGNQPHMRATALEGNRLAFRSEGVSDYKPTDEYYMGEMTLVLVDDDTIEQHWKAFDRDGVGHENVFTLHRVR